MKHLLLITALVSQVAFADCNMKSASLLANEHSVGPISNLVKDKAMGRCTVQFDIEVNGVVHHVTETERGLEQEESLCYYARERGRKNLLLDLGGEFKTEAVTVCREGQVLPPKIKKGDLILETEVGSVSTVPQYFTHKNSKCRMFEEHITRDRKLQTYHGVICQNNGSDTNWLVVDKW